MLLGNCLLYNSNIFVSFSFDLNYRGAQWEDCDFFVQIVKNGFRLLYCGTSTVFHHNLYREAKNENFANFQRKWFCDRSITPRGVFMLVLPVTLEFLLFSGIPIRRLFEAWTN